MLALSPRDTESTRAPKPADLEASQFITLHRQIWLADRSLYPAIPPDVPWSQSPKNYWRTCNAGDGHSLKPGSFSWSSNEAEA